MFRVWNGDFCLNSCRFTVNIQIKKLKQQAHRYESI